MASPTRIKGLFEAFNKALDEDAAWEGVKRLGLKADNTAADRAKALGFGDTEYHGTKTDFDKFLPEKIRGGRTAFFTAPKPNTANEFAGGNISDSGVVETLFKNFPSDFHPQVMPLRTKGKIFDYENPEHLKALQTKVGKNIGQNAPDSVLEPSNVSKGGWYAIENQKIQNAIKKLGFDGFNVAEHGTKNKGLYNASDIRSKFARFNPRLAGVGAGSILSADLLASPSSDQDLSRFAPKRQHEFQQAPSSLLDKAADAYQWTADEGGMLGEFLYGGGAKALKNLGDGTTPMVKTGRLPAMPTGAALANLLELLQL
tara:strand:- start:42 stop:986 length:945 start_codon:yes stop_codon:yes gene_type:complete